MIIRKEIEIIGSKGKRSVLALFDSGSTYSIIKKELAEKIEMLIPLPQPKRLPVADGRKIQVDHAIRADFKINGITLSDEFLIFDITSDVIIGVKTMQAWRIKLDFEKEEVIVNPEVAELLLYQINLHV